MSRFNGCSVWKTVALFPVIGLFSGLAVSTVAVAQNDWPQWRGSNRDDVSQETGLLQEWPENGPEQVWISHQGGDGYSGFAIVGDNLFTVGANADHEYAVCLSTGDGSVKWRQDIDERFVNDWGDGPRCTPTVSGDNVYVLSAKGTVACLKATDGSVVWTKSLTGLGGEAPYWGYSESLLVDDGKVLCTPGGDQGAIVALDEKTGDVIWQSVEFTAPAQYSSMIVGNHSDKRHYVQLTMKSLVGIDPENGSLLWQHEFPGETAVIPTPIFFDNKVYATASYGAGSTLVDISNLAEPRQVWSNKIMKNHHGGVIMMGDHLYGYSDQVGWVCQDVSTGDLVWSNKDDLGKGAIGYADGRFYLVAESSGEVVLIDATPDGWQERGRFTLGPQSEYRKSQGAIWVHPTVANGRLYLRDQELIYCFDVSVP
ncbi:MAG: PQQ-binding-like beta-propeller repeat protein [Pirellulaceae bacterium]